MSSDVQEYRGQKVLIRFEGKKCIHARHCVLGRPDVFIPNAPGAWIQPDGASAEAVAHIANNCPSGAITYERLDGGEQESPPKVNTARIRENGPVALHAEMELGGEKMLRATLCRCGASANKPYCDGSHATAGFQATGEPASQDSQPLAARDGALKVTPLSNGPLMVEGNLELITGTGHTVTRTEKCFLCRCGASAKKPFCDGTHKKIGFTDGT
ncbi:MAG: CDGSH iron-sulfur domain-containing protein [Polyangiaceae bacterium]